MGQQASIPHTPAGTSLAGQTVLVIGGNTGLGFEIARKYLVLQASRVIISVRSESKGESAISALRADPEVKASNPSAIIEAFLLDLGDYKSGFSFAQKVKAEVPELSILLCNAGVNLMSYEESKSGHEMVMQVNCYTHFLTAFELLPLLRTTSAKKGIPSRLTFVGSEAQYLHTLAKHPITPQETLLEHFDNRQTYDGLRRYADAKLVVNAFIRRFASTISPHEVIINNASPGMIASGWSGFDRGLPLWIKVPVFFVRKARARTLEVGGRILVYASIVAGPETHGKLLHHNKIEPGAPFLDEKQGKKFIEKLWSEVVADVKVVDAQLEIVG